MKPKSFDIDGSARPRKSRRNRRVASLIREIISEAIVRELHDPRIQLVTVTGVNLSADMREAEVLVSVMGDPGDQQRCLEALRHAHGFFQERVGDDLKMRFTPVVRFVLDESVKKSVAISALIAQARAEDEAARAERARRDAEDDDTDDDASVAGEAAPEADDDEADAATA
jgi:ribosome-binding factor A